MGEKKNNKRFIWVIGILIVLVLGLIGFVVYDKVIKADNLVIDNNKTTTNSTTTSKKEIINKLCSDTVYFENEKYQYDFNSINDEMDLQVILYDKNKNVVAKIVIPKVNMADYETQEEILNHKYCDQFYIKISNISSDEQYQYNVIELIEKDLYFENTEYVKSYQIYSFIKNKYDFIIDLSVLGETRFKNIKTDEIIESFRIKDKSIYVIANSLLSESFNDTKLPEDIMGQKFKEGEELKFTFKNNTYEVLKTGNIYEGFSGIA